MFIYQVGDFAWESDEFPSVNQHVALDCLSLGLASWRPSRNYGCYMLAISLDIAQALRRCDVGQQIIIKDLDTLVFWVGRLKEMKPDISPKLVISDINLAQ